MKISTYIRWFGFWLAGLEMMPFDIKIGDWIVYADSCKPLQVVDINWACRAIVVRYNIDSPSMACMVYPMRKTIKHYVGVTP